MTSTGNNAVLNILIHLSKICHITCHTHQQISIMLWGQTDFVKLAEAFGATAFRATTGKEFKSAFEKAIKCGGPVVIDTIIDKDEMVLPMLPPGGSIDDIITNVEK